MAHYELVKSDLRKGPKTWLITGAAGFIGSNLVERLLQLDQAVIGLDNFATGFQRNLDSVRAAVTGEQWARFKFLRGDIRMLEDCRQACAGVDYVLHQAALGSVPRSIADPISTNEANVTGFLNMLVAGRDANVSSFVYAASSSTYGDHQALPKQEENIGKPLSPYAVSKYVNELYADVFFRCYGLRTVGLRYFNIFGPRQDPNGAYAAVIPRWISSLLTSEAVRINGDGKTTRDFSYIENAVQANILAATADLEAQNQVYNIAVGDSTSLNTLFCLLRDSLVPLGANPQSAATYHDFRPGDVLHSRADISKARRLLGYEPTHTLVEGIKELVSLINSTATKAGD